MMRRIRAHCSMNMTTFGFYGEMSNILEHTKLLGKNRESPEYFQCLANVMGEAWTVNDEEEVWSQFQPNLQLHLDDWKKCVDAGNSEAVIKYV